jgi:hypothetical protein
VKGQDKNVDTAGAGNGEPARAKYLRSSRQQVQTASEADVVECFAPVERDYPLQFVSREAVRRDEKLHFVAGTGGRASRDQYFVGK